ncbi:MAG: chorismate mutase [Methanoculleus sp. SDB]|nr:MAG: chorismate mutase [Methanoculleus sp. SDB]
MPLEELRNTVALIDKEIIALIARRQKAAREIGVIKHREGLPIQDSGQREAVLERVLDAAVEQGIDPAAVQRIFSILIGMSEETQREFTGEGNLP